MPQEPMASSSPKPLTQFEQREVDHDCPKHGMQRVKIIKLFSDWNQPSCPACEREREQAKADDEQRRRAHADAERKRQRIESMLKGSGIPPRFNDRSFDTFNPPNDAALKILDVCRDYAVRFPEYQARGTGMIFCGNPGAGKSHMACAIANHVITQHQKSAVFLKTAKAIRMVKETYGKASEKTEQQALDWFKIPDLLILDEVGVQFGTDAERYILFEIINERYEGLKPTILLSNLNIEGLKEYAGDRVLDRMRENGGRVLGFTWGSYRANVGKENA